MRMPGRLMGLQVQDQHIRLDDEDQLVTDTEYLEVTKDVLVEDTTASEDTTQECMVCQISLESRGPHQQEFV